jgi:bifunctional DNA-binding transcriptional regulator/antitoxin component of YhaV-PrlF toxin-antitoxin module
MRWSNKMTTGRVQDCGCIALPEPLQERTGLYPGATYRIELTLEGHLILVPLSTHQRPDPKPGARCG